MGNSPLIFFLLFINLYFPISPILVTGVDIFVAFWYCKDTQIRPYFFLITSTFLLLFFSIISFILADDPEYQVLFKYTRTFISTIAILTIAQKINISPKTFIKLTSLVFICHQIAIVLQIIYPPLGIMMAPYFNFSRELTFLETIQLRKLGLCGGYDAASMVLIASLIFFYLNFLTRKNIVFFILALTSAILTLFVSRLGLLFAGGILFIFAITSIKKRGTIRATGILLVVLSLFFTINFILPILANTNGLLFDIAVSSQNDVSYYTQDYRSTNGSIDELTNEHLFLYEKLNFLQTIIGAGISSDSDIGYIQILFQVGLVGLLIIIMLHAWIVITIKRSPPLNDDLKTIQLFCFGYITSLFFFNYKILLLYSRGFYDFFILCCIYYISATQKIRVANEKL